MYYTSYNTHKRHRYSRIGLLHRYLKSIFNHMFSLINLSDPNQSRASPVLPSRLAVTMAPIVDCTVEKSCFGKKKGHRLIVYSIIMLREACYPNENRVKPAKLAIEKRGSCFSTQTPCFANGSVVQAVRTQQQTKIRCQNLICWH